jgi:hypothetical protein
VTSENPAPPFESEFSLLDVALVLAKNIRKLIFVPLAAGLAVYGLTCLLPKSYTSVTVINNMGGSTDAKAQGFGSVTAADVLLRTAVVLDKVVAQFKIHGDTPEVRRNALERKITVLKVRNEAAATLSVNSDNPETSKNISKALIEAWLPYLRVTGAERSKLENKIKAVQAEQEILATHIKTLEQEVVTKDTAIALVTLYTQQRDARRELVNLQEALKEFHFEDVVLSGPTLPDEGQNKYWVLGPVAGIVTLMAVAGLAVLRELYRGGGRGSGSANSTGQNESALTLWRQGKHRSGT